ncbi:helix-turn-helix domain-containing protein [Candidatus Merdisoma sp. HCP28S3_D10]|uniref:helix-turn-helix domain-containing protein n=1 Tax=unclassified Candidatus Merdisoma TaxID=3099611 RepID=UPI003F8A20CB
MEFDKTILFRNLDRILKERNLTQKEFCKSITYDLQPDVYSKMKHGNTSVPVEFLFSASQYLNISIDELVGNPVKDRQKNLAHTYQDVLDAFSLLYKEFGFHFSMTSERDHDIFTLEYSDPFLYNTESSPCNPESRTLKIIFLEQLFRAIQAAEITHDIKGIDVFDLWYSTFKKAASNYTLSGERLYNSSDIIEEFDETIRHYNPFSILPEELCKE